MSPNLDPCAAASVVICAHTLRRWPALRRAVSSLHAQTLKPEQIIVVIDGNDQLLARARHELVLEDIPVHVVPNSRTKGLSGARNTGVLLADCPVVAFLDDDAIAEPGWLQAIMNGFEAGVLAVGGWATPLDSTAIPAWWPREYDWVVGCSHVGLPAQGGSVRNVLGCTMAFKREAFCRVGLFHEGIGRAGNTALGCEETELCIRLTTTVGGQPVRLVPGALIRHDVEPERFSARYLVKRCFAEGRSKAKVKALVGPRALSAESAHIRSTLPKAFARALGGVPLGRKGALGMAAAIVGGVGVAGAGFIQETLAEKLR